MQRIKNYLLPKYNQLLGRFHVAPPIMSNEETISQLALNRKSCARFGDGEMTLILQTGEVSFQQRNSELSRRLNEVLCSKQEGFLVGLPRIFSDQDLSERKESSAKFWRNNLLYTRHEWYKRIDFSWRYASSTFTRNYLTLRDQSESSQYFASVQRIWNNRKVLIIEGQNSRVGVGNSLFSNACNVTRIICPSKNAYFVYSQILDAALKVPKDYLVLIALGPTATVLAYDLWKAGYQAIDIGHLDVEFEWFLRGSSKLEQLPGKWVAEAGGMSQDPLSQDQHYLSQIADIISL